MHQELIQAIEQKKVVRIFYSAGYRDIEPHTYGLGTSGNKLLRAYQFAGASESGLKEGWKLFKLDEIDSLEISDSNFQVRPKYARGDRVMSSIYAEV